MNTRQQIIEATERIIRARGIAHATTKEIAREAGCAEGTLYKHFERKEDLFLLALEQQLPSFIEALGECVPGRETVRGNLERVARAALGYYEQLIPLAAAFFSDGELLARYRAVMTRVDGGPQRTYQRVADYIKEEQDLGRLDARPPALSIASLLLGPCFQYVFLRQFMGASPLSLNDEQFVAGVVETLLGGIAPGGREEE